jgi:chemotaxis protein CheX
MTTSGQAAATPGDVGGAVQAEETAGDQPRLQLAEILDRAAAAPLLADLMARRGQEIVIDASGVRRIGGQCLQILMSAAATWSQDAVTFAVTSASPEFVAGVRQFGVDSESLSPVTGMNGAA